MNQLTQMLCDLLDLKPTEVGPTLMREQVDAWDSLAHLRLMTAVEEAFALKFTMQEIESVDGLPRLVGVLEAHGKL